MSIRQIVFIPAIFNPLTSSLRDCLGHFSSQEFHCLPPNICLNVLSTFSPKKGLTNSENKLHWLLQNPKLLTSSGYPQLACVEMIRVDCHEMQFPDQRLISILNMVKDLHNFKMRLVSLVLYVKEQRLK